MHWTCASFLVKHNRNAFVNIRTFNGNNVAGHLWTCDFCDSIYFSQFVIWFSNENDYSCGQTTSHIGRTHISMISSIYKMSARNWIADSREMRKGLIKQQKFEMANLTEPEENTSAEILCQRSSSPKTPLVAQMKHLSWLWWQASVHRDPSEQAPQRKKEITAIPNLSCCSYILVTPKDGLISSHHKTQHQQPHAASRPRRALIFCQNNKSVFCLKFLFNKFHGIITPL